MNNHGICVDAIFSNEDHARAIEDAIKAAIEQVIGVFRDISRHRFRELQVMVAEKEEENKHLKMQMESAERELMSLRRSCCPAGSFGGIEVRRGHETVSTHKESVEENWCSESALRSGHEEMQSESDLKEMLARPCDGLIGYIKPQEPLVASHIQNLWHSVSNNGSCSEGERHQSAGPLGHTGLPVKNELSDFEEINIKWEVCEDSTEEPGGLQRVAKDDTNSTRSPVTSPVLPGNISPSAGRRLNCTVSPVSEPREEQAVSAVFQQTTSARLSNKEKMQRYRARIRADPQRYQAYRETNRRRYQMRKKSIGDLPEQCQRLLRAAWREAARRHRARKKSSSWLSLDDPCIAEAHASAARPGDQHAVWSYGGNSNRPVTDDEAAVTLF